MPSFEIPEKLLPFTEPHRWKVAYGGRGGAKSWGVADILVAMALSKPLRILCTREIQGSIDESVKKLLEDRIDDCGVSDKFTITTKKIECINGSEFIFEGLRYNVDRIKSMEAVDICWVEEADVVSSYSWSILIPTIRKEGSEIWATFNPRLSTDWVYQRFIENGDKVTDAVIIPINWRDNPWFTDVLKQEMLDLKAIDHDAYLHTYEGQLREYAEGAVYAQQLRQVREDGRLCELPLIRSQEVHTFWDLGKDDSTAVWFMQQDGPWDNFVHYYEDRFEDIDHYVTEVKRIAEERGMILGNHYMPHDVEHKIFGMPETRKKQFENAGIKPVKVVPRINVLQEGIMMSKRRFSRCRFDSVHAADGWKCLANYRRSYNEVNGKYSDEPVHDWACHGADAFRQYAQGYRRDRKGAETAHLSERRKEAIKRNKRGTSGRLSHRV